MTATEKWALGLALGLAGLLVLVFILVPLAATGLPPEWTGFGPKTFWDWLQLLIIPLFLAAAGYVLSRMTTERDKRREQAQKELDTARAERQQTIDRQLAAEREQVSALETYLDRMSHLLLDGATRQDAQCRAAVRAQTAATIPRLNARRNTLLLQFLRESHLIERGGVAIDLSGIDLTAADLAAADLRTVDLTGTILDAGSLRAAQLADATLLGANLRGTNLVDANLARANLAGADLTKANLARANLTEVDLTQANLTEANLAAANLLKATVTDAQLAQAASVAGMTRPDGTIVPP